MAMGGGGGSSGGMVVGGPTQNATVLAGIYQANAAQQANQYATEAMNNAIAQLQQQYRQARYDVQPYRTEGVQALNQLNQYMGLDPYNPGNAPTAVTLDSEKAKITDEMVQNYLRANTSLRSAQDHNDRTWAHPVYTGVGSTNADLLNAYKNAWANAGPDSAGYSGGIESTANTEHQAGYDPYDLFVNQGPLGNIIKDSIINKLAQQNYDLNRPGYEQNLAEYNQNKAWYDQKLAEGPYTSAQIADKISNLPGYQAELSQGIDAIAKNASAKGYLGSGRLLKELGSYGQGTLSQFYGNELSRLAGLAGAGQNAASQSAQGSMGLGNNLASLYQSLGDTRANSALASGNALAQAILAGNQQYKIIGGGDSGGGGLGGLGSVLGGIGSIASAFTTPCSRELKNPISKPSTKEILDQVNKLDIETWRYKDIDRVHLGPYAEDVLEKLGIGNGKSINMLDMVGALFASVQELSKQLKDLQAMKGVKKHA